MTKIGYMTVDDSPTDETADKVELLDSKGIPAVWFCRGDYLEKRPGPAVKAVESGHVIGNHAYSHTRFSELSVDEARNEIERTDEIIETVYERAGVERQAKYFRFPYLDRGFDEDGETHIPKEDENKRRVEEIQSFLRELGYSKPGLGITYPDYSELGCGECIDFYFTYMPEIYEMDDDWTLEDILEAMDSDDLSIYSIEYPDSNELLILHDHLGTYPVFEKIVEKIAEKDIEFRLP